MKEILSSNKIFVILAASILSIILGFSFVLFSPLIILVGLTGILFIFITLKSPEFALLGILIITSSIINTDQLPSVNFGGITLQIPDLILFGLFVLLFIRLLVEHEFKLIHSPLDLPLLIFFAITLFTTYRAALTSTIKFTDANGWIRTMSYYLSFFLVTNLVRKRSQLKNLIYGIFLLGTVVALAMIAQFLIGPSIQILPGRVQDLSAEGENLVNILRIAPPGLSVILVSFFALMCIVILRKSPSINLFELFQIGSMGLSILLTFLRSIWASIILAISFMLIQVKGRDRQKMIVWGIALVFLLVIALLFIYINPDSRTARMISATADRFSTLISSKTLHGQDSSLQWRMLENKYAFVSIAKHPLLGIGLGARYRPFDRRLTVYGDPYDYRMHIHNGFLWIILDMGLIGFLCFIWLSIAFLWRGFRQWRNAPTDKLKGVMLGFTLVYLSLIISAVANSTFIQVRWTPVIGILMGINEVIIRRSNEKVQ